MSEEEIKMPLWNGMVLYAYTNDKKLKQKLLKGIRKAFERIEG